jgi:hypothetical protein
VSCKPPIATLGETASALQVLPKGPVIRACWCVVRVEPWVCPCANTSPNDIFLTSTNYFSWKSHMEDVLISKGLYQITLGKEMEPTGDENKFKWDNKSDKECGLIGMSISPDLRFHLQGIDAPDETWTKIEVVFDKHNIIRAHQIENQSMTLSPNDFYFTEYYLSKFKTHILLCIDCKIDMKED